MGEIGSHVILALAGHAGAGKSTAAKYLARLGSGSVTYVGEYIKAEVGLLGLNLNAQNERTVRMEVREREGMDAFARRALPDIEAHARLGPVLIDAIYNREEWEFYRRALSTPPVLIGILASQGKRAQRVAKRGARRISREDLERRDRTELDLLHLGDVLEQADHRICNDATKRLFKKRLGRILSALSS